jgi:hypothetical protein
MIMAGKTKPVAWEEGDVFLKRTAPDGAVTFTQHRAWHCSNFIKLQIEAAQKETDDYLKKLRDEGKTPDDPDWAPYTCEAITREEFKRNR